MMLVLRSSCLACKIYVAPTLFGYRQPVRTIADLLCIRGPLGPSCLPPGKIEDWTVRLPLAVDKQIVQRLTQCNSGKSVIGSDEWRIEQEVDVVVSRRRSNGEPSCCSATA